MHLTHQTGTLERQYLLLPLALHWHFIFRIAAFVILKKLIQRILWARYYTIIPQTKRKSILQQLGYSYSTPIQLSEWSAAKWLCVFWHTKTKVFFFTTHLLEDGKMLFFPPSYFRRKFRVVNNNSAAQGFLWPITGVILLQKKQWRKQVLCSPVSVTAPILSDTLETTAKVKRLSCDSMKRNSHSSWKKIIPY